MKLFLSHASEDKPFVIPLKEALERKGHEVWLDTDDLRKLGSLRQQIDDGLNTCDYGVVILSNAYFQKEWTQAEFNGLWALERENGKLFLTVWHNVVAKDVLKFSPMLADHPALISDNDPERVADDIDKTIRYCNIERKIITCPSVDRMLSLDQKLQENKFAIELLASPSGIEVLQKEFVNLQLTIESHVATIAQSATEIKLILHKDSGYGRTVMMFQIESNKSFDLIVTLKGLFPNNIGSTQLVGSIARKRFDEQAVKFVCDEVKTFPFKPKPLISREVAWIPTGKEIHITTKQLASISTVAESANAGLLFSVGFC